MPCLIIGGALTFGALLMTCLLGFVGTLYLGQTRLASGVSVAGIPLGGKTPGDAAQYLMQNMPDPTISLTDGSRTWPLKLSDLGVKIDIDASISAAESAPAASSLTGLYTINLNQAQNTLVALSQQVNIPAAQDKPGRAVEIPAVLDRLRVDVTGELSDGKLELSMIETEPLKPDPDTDPPSTYTGKTTTHIVQSGQELGLIAKEYNVTVADIVKMNGIGNPDLLYVGQKLTIPAPGLYEPTQADAPPAPSVSGKSILVSTGQQRIYAYQDGKLLRSHLASTGLPATPTVLGDYKIYVKYLADDMSGPGYYLPQVPYTMYFYQGYGIHGTYWHNNFGRPMSHGCVNLPTDEAQWFFNWAEVGTPVRVI
jgi:lipoprotein-anchoring transpeptidase ErfK/SrfK